MLIADLASFLHTWGIGVYDPTGMSGDIFVSVLPSDYDNCISLYDTGGTGAELPDDHIRAVQVIVRNVSYASANAKAWDIYRTVRVATLLGTRKVIVKPAAPPAPIGADGNRRHEFSINFQMWSAGD